MMNYDLVVVGGGTGGALAALRAAKNGIKVLIIEKQNSLGGLATQSGLAEFNAQTYKKQDIYHGIEKEIFDELLERGDAQHYFQLPMSSNKDIKVDRLRYNPETLKIVLDHKAQEYGVAVYYDTVLTMISETDGGFSLELDHMGNIYDVFASYVIDGTSNCEIAQLLGCEVKTINTEKLLVSTQVFRLSNVNISELQAFIASPELQNVIDKGIQEGALQGRILAFSPIPGSHDVSVNVTRTNVDHTDVASYSKGVTEARGQIDVVVNFLKREVSALENASIANIAPLLGVRDSVKIEGKYTLTLDDLQRLAKFKDAIAVGAYPVDVHDPVTKKVHFIELNGMYTIPFACCIPQKDINLAVVGKAISTDYEAFAATRVMPIVMNVGESIGALIAYAAKQGRRLHNLTEEEITQVVDQYNLVERNSI